MNRIKIILLIFIVVQIYARGQTFFSGISDDFISDSKSPLVEVVKPNGGERFNYLEQLLVEWTSSDESFGSTPISIAISTEIGGDYTVVASNLPNTGSALVTPPGVLTEFAKILVISVDTFGIEASDESDNYFTFDENFSGTSDNFITDSKQPVVEVINPNGGESHSYLDPLLVTWDAADESFGSNPISIAISTEESGAYTIVASNLPNSGSAIITPPGIITNYAKIKVIAIDTFGIETKDESDYYFTFNSSFSGTSENFVTDSKPPLITVIAPNGGESYYFGDPLKVIWSANDDSFGVNPVTISISNDAGNTFIDLANGLPDNDSAFVTVPQEINNQALIKVFIQDKFGLSAFDVSDSLFFLHGIYIDLKAFLQGPFAGSGMFTFLNMQGFIPTLQPYNAPPWNYNGTENASPIPNSNIVDWILIEIREAQDAISATPETMVSQKAGFILNNGKIVSSDGTNYLEFEISVNKNLFAIVHHRNHLPIMSAFPLTKSGSIYSYDFTSSANNVFGGSLAISQLVSGIWGMTSGDANADGQIDNKDKNDIWFQEWFSSGYFSGDLDMNGTVLNSDLQTQWNFNCGKSKKTP